MLIGFPKENDSSEARIAILPDQVKKYVKLGINVAIEADLGKAVNISSQNYADSGAVIFDSKDELLAKADVIARVRKPLPKEIAKLKEGAVHISFLDPFNEPVLIDNFAAQKISSISMEMVPRTTKAQKMDAISSQANLAGYAAVLLAAHHSQKAFPMMVTAAGTIEPCRVFIIGVGVAGLQAIATAKRLGARVEAFDTRKETEEQVKSLGAKFVKIDLGTTEQTKDGYAKALTNEQLEKQRQEMNKVCARSDIIITTAQVFGRKAPILITEDMLQNMQAGTIIIDMAVASGGNVAGSVAGQDVVVNKVKIIGQPNLAGTLALHASQMYANNILHLVEHFFVKEQDVLQTDPLDEIMQGCLLTKNGAIINPQLKPKTT